jgi:hypothetical protein
MPLKQKNLCALLDYLEQIKTYVLFFITRVARLMFNGIPYHIISKGNNRQRIFNDDDYFNKYLYTKAVKDKTFL